MIDYTSTILLVRLSNKLVNLFPVIGCIYVGALVEWNVKYFWYGSTLLLSDHKFSIFS